MMGFLFGGPPQPGMRGPQAPHQYDNYQHAYPHQGQYTPTGQAYSPQYTGHQYAIAPEQPYARQQHVYSEQHPAHPYAEYAQPEPEYVPQNAGYNGPVVPHSTAVQPQDGYVNGYDTVYGRGTLAPYTHHGPQETNTPYMTQPVNPYAETGSTAHSEPVQGYHDTQPDPHTLSHQYQHISIPHHTAQYTPQEAISEQYRHGIRPPAR